MKRPLKPGVRGSAQFETFDGAQVARVRLDRWWDVRIATETDGTDATAPKPRGKDYRAVARELFDVLKKISKGYQTPDQIRRSVEDRRRTMYGLHYEEALEMAYDNIQAEAAQAIAKRRRP